MKANEMKREDVIAFVESDDGASFLESCDEGWGAVMEAAKAEGFIIQAYGGTATLCTYGAMLEERGAEGVAWMLQMNGIDIGEGVIE